MDFVLHGAMPETLHFGQAEEFERLGDRRRDRFLGVDVLAGGDRLLQDADALLGRGRVEEDRVGGIGERGVEVGRPVGDAVQSCDGGETLGVAADQQQARQHLLAIDRQSALRADRRRAHWPDAASKQSGRWRR